MRLIFQAAIDAFSERGFERATMDEIAAKANVAKGTIYYHFKSKEDLFVFLVEEGTELLRETVLSKVQSQTTATAKLTTVIHEQLQFFQDYKDFCIIILREAFGEEKRQQDFRRMLVQYVTSIQHIIEEGVETGEFHTDQAEPVAWSVFGAISITALHHLFANDHFNLVSLSPHLEKVLITGLHTP